MLAQILAIIRLGRPIFLLGGFALYGLGALCAVALGYPFSSGAFIWGQLAITASQLTTHYSNDYFDYDADMANQTPTHWSGGSRVLVRGELPRQTALVAALVMAAVACLSTLMLVFTQNIEANIAIPVLGAVLFLSWSYSSPPLRLHSHGAGAPTVAVVVPLLTPLSGFLLQAGQLHALPLLLSLPLIALQLNMLFTLEFPDERGDRSVGKRTWVVIFGRRPVAWLSLALVIFAFGFSFGAADRVLPRTVAWAWACLLPLGIFQSVRFVRRDFEKQSAWDSLAFGSVALFFLAMIADLLAIAFYGR